VDVQIRDETETLDVCRRCHVIWFDAAEYAAVPRQPPPLPPRPADPRIVRAQVAFELEHGHAMEKATRKSERSSGLAQPEGMWKYVPGLLSLPVEFDVVPTAREAWATWSVLAIVGLMSLLSLFDLEEAVRVAGFVSADPWRSAGLTWLTCFFVHGGVFHLLGNLYFLWIFGDNVEDRLGTGKYLTLLALATIGGNLLHLILTDTPAIPVVGASGGISGIIMFYVLSFPRVRIGLLFFFVFWVRLSAVVWLTLWMAFQFFGMWIDAQSPGPAGVAYGAHVGGALVGLLAWLAHRFLLPGHVARATKRTLRKHGVTP
jgi:membrane associated rhomboid family serine protease